MEPNLAVKLASERGHENGLTLVWFFAHEAAPPGVADSVRYGTGFAVRLEVSAPAVGRAAEEWVDDVRRFPARAAAPTD